VLPPARAPENLLWPPRPFAVFHLFVLAAPFVAFHWTHALAVLASYYARMFWVTAGYHRYFSHRSFKTTRAFQLVIAFLAMTSMQKGVLWWAAHHRTHHRYSDGPRDVHSALQSGFWWSHVGWVLSTRYDATDERKVRDLARYPELRWLDRHWLVPPVIFFAALFAFGGASLLVWAGVIGTIVLWHGTFSINSLAHKFGRRRYDTHDESRNSFALALLTCGEGWHNNHHHYAVAANQGWRWWQIDVTYYGLRVLAAVGLIRDLRSPPPHVLAAPPPAVP
jgi:stearoyl-CoA desaturase (delta-9 desaturase)